MDDMGIVTFNFRRVNPRTQGRTLRAEDKYAYAA